MSSSKSSPIGLKPISAADLHEFLCTRRSIRHFVSEVIPAPVIQRILETAVRAPSAHNRQPWRFAIITDPHVKFQLADALGAEFRRDLTADQISTEEIEIRIEQSRKRITSAPVVIVLCLDPSDIDVYPDDKRNKAEFIMAVQSVAATGLQLLLAVHAEGLAGVWTCGPLFAPQVVIKSLDLPREWEPQAMFFIGRSSSIPSPKHLIPIEKITIWR